MTTMLDLLKKGAVINPGNLKRAQRHTTALQVKSNTVGDATTWTARVVSVPRKNDGYEPKIRLTHAKAQPSVEIDCACVSWRTNRGAQDGMRNTQPCKHILALAEKADIPPYVTLDTSGLVPVSQ